MVQTCLAAWSELMRKLNYSWLWRGPTSSDAMMGSCWTGSLPTDIVLPDLSSELQCAGMGISRLFARPDPVRRSSNNTKRASTRTGRTGSTRRSTRSVRSKARSSSRRASQRHKKVCLLSLSLNHKYFRPSAGGRGCQVSSVGSEGCRTFPSHLNTESCLEFLVPPQPCPALTGYWSPQLLTAEAKTDV